jgi:hypothetical protein
MEHWSLGALEGKLDAAGGTIKHHASPWTLPFGAFFPLCTADGVQFQTADQTGTGREIPSDHVFRRLGAPNV